MNSAAEDDEAARVGFSITAPKRWGIENLLCKLGAGGLGAVHQFLTMLAALRLAAAVRPSDALLELLCMGVIWNDFPWGSEDVKPERFRRAIIERISAGTATYLTHKSFRLQANEQTRWAVAAVYKNVPSALCSMAGVNEAARQTAAAILAQRTKPEPGKPNPIYYHFMRATRDDSDANVVAQAAAVCKRWYYRALAEDSFFMLGHLVHLVEDSFSAAHTLRVQPSGALARVYFFGDQTDTTHSRAESYDAVVEEQLRMRWCVAAVAELLERYVADRAVLIEASAAAASAEAKLEAAARMSELLVREVLQRRTFARVGA